MAVADRIDMRKRRVAIAVALAASSAIGCIGGEPQGPSQPAHDDAADAALPLDAGDRSSDAAHDGPMDASLLLDAGNACGPALQFSTFGAMFFAKNCNGCHGFTHSIAQSEGMELSSLVVGGFMPPGGGTVTLAERMEFAEWIACGAP
jgi:hypothetical protein